MNRPLRSGLIIGGSVLVLLVITPFLISVDQFRPTIEATASAALGRRVDLGRLRLSLARRSLSAETLAVADDPAFGTAPFLTAGSIDVHVELWPLIVSRSVHVTGVTVERPNVALMRDSAGRWNYSSLGSSSAAPRDIAIGKLAFTDGRIVVGSTTSQVRRTYDHVNVAASELSFAARSPVTASALLPGGGGFTLTGTIGPVNRTDSSLTPVDARIAIHGLDLARAGFLEPSAGVGGLLDLEATVASTHDQAQITGNATIAKALLVAGGSPASERIAAQFSTRYDRHKHVGTLNPSTLRTGGATARLNGSYSLAGERPVVDLAVVGERMPASDLQSVLPALGIHMPKSAKLTAGTFAANLNVAGPANGLVTAGTVSLARARLSGFDLGAEMKAISAFTGVRVGRDLDIETLTTMIRIARQGLRFERFNAVVPALGYLTGAGTVDERNNLDFKMVATLSTAVGVDTVVGTSGALDEVVGLLTGQEAKISRGKAQRVPFLVKGTTSNPQFIPDVSGLVIQTLQEQVGALGTKSAPRGPARQEVNPINILGDLFKKTPR